MTGLIIAAQPGEALRLCRRGNTLVEFALVAPVLMLMIVGLLDVGYTAYVKSALQGAVQKAARDASLQDNATVAAATALDLKVTQQLQALGRSMPTPTFTRRFYRDYSAATVRQTEPISDTNGDGRCTVGLPPPLGNGETYTDRNGNGVFDADGGDAGSGGAQDRTIYTVSVSYPRPFPIFGFLNVPNTLTLSATTILANQPYADQGSYTSNPATRPCA